VTAAGEGTTVSGEAPLSIERTGSGAYSFIYPNGHGNCAVVVTTNEGGEHGATTTVTSNEITVETFTGFAPDDVSFSMIISCP
jgi:hypothetical protein